MYLGIDASNLRAGGGVTHISTLLTAADPRIYGIDKIIVWGGRNTLASMPANAPWLTRVHESVLDKHLPYRLFWQRNILPKLAKKNCDILFVPGGSAGNRFRPYVTMSRNMLPFERRERVRYGVSWMLLKMMLLHQSQRKTFLNADGVIFLTQYAHDVVMRDRKHLCGKNNVIIPHGVDKRFLLSPRVQKHLGSYSVQKPFRILYVSSVDMYKHQWHVVEAVAHLRQMRFDVTLQLVGAAYPPALKRLHQATSRYDQRKEFINYSGSVAYRYLPEVYHNADLFVFASSCENMPNILLEAMASGLPIACSKRGPMPEILRGAGVYFDPEKPDQIAEAIRKLIEDPILRAEKAESAFDRAKKFTWVRCAHETFDFLTKIAREL